MTRCSHKFRSGPLFRGHVLGGLIVGHCENEALEGFNVCLEHVTKDALAMVLDSLRQENARVKARLKAQGHSDAE